MVAENFESANGKEACVETRSEIGEKLSGDAQVLESRPLVEKVARWMKDGGAKDGGYNPTANILPALKIVGQEIDQFLTEKLGPHYGKKLLNFAADDQSAANHQELEHKSNRAVDQV